MQYVYIIDFGNMIKASYSRNIKSRCKQIEAIVGRKAINLYYTEGSTTLESILLKNLPNRLNGEFFSCPFDEAVKILTESVKELNNSEEFITMQGLGSRLAKLRKESGLTQKQLADKLRLSKAMVSYYEQSLRCPSPEMLVKLANVFHVTTDYLLGIEKKKKTIDVTGLSDEDIDFLESAVKLLRKNKR